MLAYNNNIISGARVSRMFMYLIRIGMFLHIDNFLDFRNALATLVLVTFDRMI